MARRIEICYVDDDLAVQAELLEDSMPRTCGELIKHMPLESLGTHARYSGSEVAMLLDNSIRIDRERATSAVLPGDIAYVWLDRDDHYSLDEDVSEICWFYDKDAIPQMYEGPVRVNIFAQMVGDTDAFFRACADTRITGRKKTRIRLLD